MLSKILLTLVVIVVVALVFANRRSNPNTSSTNRSPNQAPQQAPEPISESRSLSTRTVAYIILGVLLAISISLFVINYQSDNRIITIRVIAEDGASTLYQARQKSIKGRHFVTLDGRQVVLGDSDRIEMQR